MPRRFCLRDCADAIKYVNARSYMQVNEALPLILGEVLVTVSVTVMVKFVGAVAVTVTTPALTQFAIPESLMPAIQPFAVAQVSPSAWVSWRWEWSLNIPVAV